VVVVRDNTEAASWPLTGWGRPDLAVVDQLVRLQLSARRMGYSIWVRDPWASYQSCSTCLGG
jgi:hypothetical protein